MRSRVAWAASLCIVCVVSVGCEESDFGDKALAFVNDELTALSVNLTTADLRVRWPETFQVLLLDAAARLENLAELSASLEKSSRALESTAASLDGVRATRAYDHVMVKALQELEDTTQVLAAATTVCESRPAFERLGLNALGAVSALQSISAVNPELSIHVTVGSGSSEQNGADMFKSIGQLFQAKKIEEQNTKLREAIGLAPSKLVTQDQIFEISKSECSKARSAAANAIASLNDQRVSVALALSTARGLIASRQKSVELRALAIALNRTDTPAAFTTLSQTSLTGAATATIGALRLELVQAFNRLETIADASRSAAGVRRSFLRMQGKSERDVVLEFIRALRISGVLAALGDSDVAQVVDEYEQALLAIDF